MKVLFRLQYDGSFESYKQISDLIDDDVHDVYSVKDVTCNTIHIIQMGELHSILHKGDTIVVGVERKINYDSKENNN